MAVTFFASTSNSYLYPFSCLATYSQSIRSTLINAGYTLVYEGDGLNALTEEDLYYFDVAYESANTNTCNVKPWLYGNTAAATSLGSLAIATSDPISGTSTTSYVYLGCKNKFNHLSLFTSAISPVPLKMIEATPTYEYYTTSGWVELSSVTDTTSATTETSGFSLGQTGNIDFDMPSDWVMGNNIGQSANLYYIRVKQIASYDTFNISFKASCFSRVIFMVPQQISSPGTNFPKNCVYGTLGQSQYYQIWQMNDSHSSTNPLYLKIDYASLDYDTGVMKLTISSAPDLNPSRTDLLTPFGVTLAKDSNISSEFSVNYNWYISAYSSGLVFVHTSTSNSVGLLIERARDLQGRVLPGRLAMMKFNYSSTPGATTASIINTEFNTYDTDSALFLIPQDEAFGSSFTGYYTSSDGYYLGIGPMFLGNGVYGTPRLLMFIPKTAISFTNADISVKQDGVARTFYVPAMLNLSSGYPANTPYKSYIALAKS